jgi:hypothetical protein
MSEVPDLKDSSGRMRRIVLSLLIAGAVAGVSYAIAHAVVQPETEAHKMHVTSGQMSGGTFVIWVTLVSFAVALTAALGIQNALAKRAWNEEQRIAKATVR